MTTHQPSLLARVTAVLAVGLVLTLTVLSASPRLHAWLHGHEDASEHADHESEAPVGDAEHSCAVTLFAHGVETLLVFCLLLLARPLARSYFLPAGDDVAAAYPRYWLVPSHAPPLG